jgi:hypothetical protein
MGERESMWMTVICYEGQTEAIPWDTEADAREYFDLASAQWSEAFLAEVHIAPRDTVTHVFDRSGVRWGAPAKAKRQAKETG